MLNIISAINAYEYEIINIMPKRKIGKQMMKSLWKFIGNGKPYENNPDRYLLMPRYAFMNTI